MKTGRLWYRKICKISGGFLLFCGRVFYRICAVRPQPEQKTEQKPERKPKLEPVAEKETKFQKTFSLFGDCVMICYSEKS